MEQERIPQSGRYAVRSGRLVLTWIDEAGESRPDVVEAEYDGETIRVPIDTYPGEHMVYRKVQR